MGGNSQLISFILHNTMTKFTQQVLKAIPSLSLFYYLDIEVVQLLTNSRTKKKLAKSCQRKKKREKSITALFACGN